MSRVITRQKIINDCAVLFNQKGYQAVGIPEIEKATGQTKAVLYGYFENKQALAKAVLEHNLNHKRELILRQVNLQSDHVQQLLVHFDVHNPEKQLLLAGGCPILNAATETDYAHEEFRQMVAKALLVWKQDITDQINKGLETGDFKTDLTAGELAWLMISLVEGAVFISHTTQNAKLGRQLLEQAKLNFLKHLNITSANVK